MRSMFQAAPFSRFDLGRHAFRGGLGLPRLSMGQTAAYSVTDVAKDIEGLTDSTTRAKLKDKLKECQDKDGISQIVCYTALTAQVYEALKGEGKSSTTPLPPPVIQQQAPQSSFPIIPVVLAVLGAGGLIYFLATQGSKKK